MNKPIRYCLIAAAILFIGYYILLSVIDSNFLDFMLVWLLLGIICITLAIFGKKRGQKSTDNSPVPKNKKKRITIAIVSIILFSGVCYGLSILYFICTPPKYDPNSKTDYIILLGGGIKKNGDPSLTVTKRIEATANYWNSLSEKCPIIVTGGKGPRAPFAEAYMLSDELQKKGIPESFILVESKAKDTIQNFEFSASLISNNEKISLNDALSKNIVVVTNHFHMPRSLVLAKRIGFSNIASCSASTPAYAVVNNYCREILAVVKLKLRILLTGKPTLISASKVSE